MASNSASFSRAKVGHRRTFALESRASKSFPSSCQASSLYQGLSGVRPGSGNHSILPKALMKPCPAKATPEMISRRQGTPSAKVLFIKSAETRSPFDKPVLSEVEGLRVNG